PATTPPSTLSLHDALPISPRMTNRNTTLMAALLLAAACSTGCSTRTQAVKPPPGTDVGVAMIVPSGAQRMQLPGNQAFQMAFPLDRKSTRLNSSHVKISYA